MSVGQEKNILCHMTEQPDNIITYSHCMSLVTKIRHYQIGGEALIWQDDDKAPIHMPYGEITSVTCLFAPTRTQSNRYLLRIQTRGRGRIDISNSHYKSFGNFEEKNGSFVAFATELHKKIAACNPGTLFHRGSSMAGYIFSIAMAGILFVILVGAGLFFLMAGVIWIVALKIGLLVFYTPTLLRYIRRNKPASYNPLDLPKDILPQKACRDIL